LRLKLSTVIATADIIITTMTTGIKILFWRKISDAMKMSKTIVNVTLDFDNEIDMAG
jgi:hypothetical protein